jgi:hypothetical protein
LIVVNLVNLVTRDALIHSETIHSPLTGPLKSMPID